LTHSVDDYDVVIDDSDHELFIIFKSIADAKLPRLTDYQEDIIRKVLWSKKRKISYEICEEEGKVYINFPKITKFGYVVAFFKYINYLLYIISHKR
jgi:hypothetical protein